VRACQYVCVCKSGTPVMHESVGSIDLVVSVVKARLGR